MAALRAPFAIAVFLNVDCVLDNEFGLAGAVVGGAAIGLLCLITLGHPAQDMAAACRRFM